MARRTKADANLTRDRLLDAAEKLFQAQGVSRTSLAHIATEAGTTRGAIYWHFKDKADLFNAMMERITLPLEDALRRAGTEPTEGQDPLDAVYRVIQEALYKTAHDAQTGRVFDIACHKTEYVEELRAVSERRSRVIKAAIEMTEKAISESAAQHRVLLPLPPHTAAQGLHMLVDGLIQNWLLEPGSFDLEQTGQQTIDTYLRGLGLAVTKGKPGSKQ